jgi:hypothetical protein
MTDLKKQVEAKLSHDSQSKELVAVSEDALIDLMDAELDKVTGAVHGSAHASGHLSAN